MKRILNSILTIGLLLPAAALAHDASQHKGKPVEGEVVSVAKDRFELKTAAGTVPVTFSSKTKFEHGTQTVDSTHVTKGEKVQVFGTKLPSGDLVAREVLIGVASKGATTQMHEGHETTKKSDDPHAGHTPAGKKK